MLSRESSGAAERLRNWGAEIAIILGSGLNNVVCKASNEQIIAYSEFQELPRPSVPGHEGRFVLGTVNNVRVIFAQGRLHLYEGVSPRDVAAVTRILAASGIKTLIVTNAAGSVNPKFGPGGWMLIKDHINLTGTSPLLGSSSYGMPLPPRGRSAPGEMPTFLDLTAAYCTLWRERFAQAASKVGIRLHEGVYAGLLGPQYETPAEVRMLQKIGADAVGMSTVLEVIQARALGLAVVGFSCLTNFAAGISETELSHDEVLDIGKTAANDFAKLLDTAL